MEGSIAPSTDPKKVVKSLQGSDLILSSISGSGRGSKIRAYGPKEKERAKFKNPCQRMRAGERENKIA